MIGKRISIISSDEQEIDKAKDGYNKALEMSGFIPKTMYTK